MQPLVCSTCRLMAWAAQPPGAVLASTWDAGAGIAGAGDGPHKILDCLIGQSARLPAPQWFMPDGLSNDLGTFVDHTDGMAQAVSGAIRQGSLLLLSGDHGNATGWVSGIRDALLDARIGVVWIDAHGDLHSPFTSPSMNVHGMPSGALLDADNAENALRPLSNKTWMDWQQLKRLGRQRIIPKLSPEDVVLVDARDLEPEEWRSAAAQGIRVFTPLDRRRLGINGLLQAIRDRLSACDVIYISFDVDAVDGELAPGAGCPVGDGMNWQEAQALLTGLMRLPAFRALEIAEFNPYLDCNGKTLAGIHDVLQQAWPGMWGKPTMSHGKIERDLHDAEKLGGGVLPVLFTMIARAAQLKRDSDRLQVPKAKAVTMPVGATHHRYTRTGLLARRQREISTGRSSTAGESSSSIPDSLTSSLAVGIAERGQS